MVFADDYKMSVACAFSYSLLFIFFVGFSLKAGDFCAKADWMSTQKNVYIWFPSSSVIPLNLSCAFREISDVTM